MVASLLQLVVNSMDAADVEFIFRSYTGETHTEKSAHLLLHEITFCNDVVRLLLEAEHNFSE